MIPYSELLKKNPLHSKIPYVDLLNTVEWHEKRKKIILRDKLHCSMCGEEETMYIQGAGNIWLREDHKKDYAGFKDGEGFVEKEINWVEYFGEEADKPYYLQVHHKYHILTNLPWDYPDEDLITYCNWCHWKFHQENVVDVFQDSQKLKLTKIKVCSRCNGTGWFPQYSHVENGVCFECRGQRFSIE